MRSLRAHLCWMAKYASCSRREGPSTQAEDSTKSAIQASQTEYMNASPLGSQVPIFGTLALDIGKLVGSHSSPPPMMLLSSPFQGQGGFATFLPKTHSVKKGLLQLAAES
eukprot:CAMPEP_0183395350 /NCGR_PEP_ID=MMETSP0370-20130417/9252_1 /TAXON_ID=268820 /ORGANISM="Peridinium aciculiferum, Strain PAER-2" /LENGTH=109 /DNA_ID=CAMNT_0025575937 /DNA_START=121 /DNA_END=447 /DNA_ORIENTATION=+